MVGVLVGLLPENFNEVALRRIALRGCQSSGSASPLPKSVHH